MSINVYIYIYFYTYPFISDTKKRLWITLTDVQLEIYHAKKGHSQFNWIQQFRRGQSSTAVYPFATWLQGIPLLVGGDWNMTFIFPYIMNNHPNWLSYFSDGLKPPTRLDHCHMWIYFLHHMQPIIFLSAKERNPRLARRRPNFQHSFESPTRKGCVLRGKNVLEMVIQPAKMPI